MCSSDLAYILKNPEIIREAVEALQAKEQQSTEERRIEAMAKLKDELNADPSSPVLGNPAGDITVVEFFDYRCPYCKRAAPVIEQLIKEDGRIRRVMKEFPILGPDWLLRFKLMAIKLFQSQAQAH